MTTAAANANPFCFTGEKTSYALVVDAASSGSRIRVYTWVTDVNNDPVLGWISEITPPPETEANFETEPGLNSYAPSGIGAGESLAPLIDAAKTLVPANAWGRTPLYVLCTGGLRALPKPEQLNVLANTREYLAGGDGNNPFLLMDVDIISGENEALSGYSSINYDRSKTSSQPFMGVMDMGGATTQLTFQPEEILANSQFLLIGDKIAEKFSQSYPSFGQDLTQERYLNNVVMTGEVSGNNTYSAACFRSGYLEPFTTSVGETVLIQGEGDGAACASAINELLHLDYYCPLKPCGIMGRYTPEVNNNIDYVGISGFYYNARTLGLVEGDGGIVTHSQFYNASLDYCAEPQLPDDGIYDKISCFRTIYSSQVLAANGFAENDTPILMARRINGRTADWTLGALVQLRAAASLSCEEFGNTISNCDCGDGSGKEVTSTSTSSPNDIIAAKGDNSSAESVVFTSVWSIVVMMAMFWHQLR